jgi:hypothetical protein
VTPLPCGVQPHRPLRAPTRRLRRLAASSFVVGPHRRAGQFALPAPAPSGTAFNREASAHSLHGTARRSPSGTYRRPSTSCAHRLRKPDHACELLAPYVAPRIRDRGLLPRALAHPVGWPFSPGRLPRGTPRHPGFRHARLTVTAAGLERRTIDEPERLPSDRPGPCGLGGLDHACCSRAWPRPAPCRLPRSRPAPSRAGGPLQAIPWLPAHAPVTRDCAGNDGKDASFRLLQPTSPHEHPADCSIPGCVSLHVTPCGASHRDTPARPGPWTGRRRGRVPRCRLPDEPTRWSFA